MVWGSRFDGCSIAKMLMSIWNELFLVDPLQVETIMISIISMLSSPNDESPANVDAAKMWRESRDEFKKKVSTGGVGVAMRGWGLLCRSAPVTGSWCCGSVLCLHRMPGRAPATPGSHRPSWQLHFCWVCM